MDLIFSTILDLMPSAYYQTGLALGEMEKKLIEGVDGGSIEFNLLIHTHKCFSCGESTLNEQCLSVSGNSGRNGHCAYEPVMRDHTSAAAGSQLLILSLKMRCLSEAS